MIRLLHLSDAHFGSKQSRLLRRVDKIAQISTDSLSEDCTEIILLCNGDFANKGNESEFDVARTFLKELSTSLGKKLKGQEVSLIVLPGNHDCNFGDKDQELRQIALNSLAPEVPPASIEESIFEPLANYFRFVGQLGELNVIGAISDDKKYLRQFRHSVDKGILEFNLLNSAWMSERNEQANKATFPLTELVKTGGPDLSEFTSLSIAIMHHPLNWFRQPDTMTQLRDWIEGNCNVVITGHEHTPREGELWQPDSKLVICEGGALQEWDLGESSCFQIIDIRFEDKSIEICRVEYDENRKCYFVTKKWDERIDLGATKSSVRFDSKHLCWLEDPMLPIASGLKESATLNDFYIYPDLNEYTSSVSPEDRKVIPSLRVFEEIEKSKRCLLTGDERCGKTAIARKLILELRHRGKIPVFVTGLELKESGFKPNLTKLLAKCVGSQYTNLTFEELTQNHSEKMVAVIDDWDEAYKSRGDVSEILKNLEEVFQQLIVIGSTEISIFETQANDEDFGIFTGYRKFYICEFGQLRVEALTRKWIEMTNVGTGEKKANTEIKKLTNQIQNVLAADVIPHQPWILIVLLQQSVETDTLVVRNGSYGHMYQAIITAALAQVKIPGLGVSGQLSYLGGLAYKIYESKDDCISVANAREFHQEHCKHVDIPFDFESTVRGLEKAGVLRCDETGVKIVSRYGLCFFVAWHIHRNIHEDWAKAKVVALAEEVHDTLAANTLLFLAHLNADPFIIQEIRSAAGRIFVNSEMADLDTDVEVLNNLGGIESNVKLDDTSSDPSENREKFIESKESKTTVELDSGTKDLQIAAIALPEEERSKSLADQILEIQSSYKMIRILGQVLKNGADTLDANTKVSMVDEVFRLSRRMLGSALNELEDVDKWRQAASQKITDENTQEGQKGKYLTTRQSVEQLSIQTDREIIGICWMACFTLIKVVGEATGASVLEQTFRRVVEKDPSIPNQLFRLDVFMEHSSDFPLKEAEELLKALRKNRFTAVLLKSLVAHHFYLYETRFDLRQKVCDRLEIGLEAKKAIGQKGKKIRPGKSLKNRKR